MQHRSYSTSDALISLRPGAEWVLRGDDLEWLDSEQTEPSQAELSAEVLALADAEPMRALREERNRLLAETDWWAVSDRTMTAPQKNYRSALRDFPADANVADPVWPVKPE
jgi:hypothetical protein